MNTTNQSDLINAFKNVFSNLSQKECKDKYYQAMPIADNSYIHYELLNYNGTPEWHVEFHAEGAWSELRTSLWDIANSEEGKRDYYYATYYSSTYLKCRRPAFTPEQVIEDAQKLRELIAPKLRKLKGLDLMDDNSNASTGIQNLVPLKGLLELNLCIPEYQRPYCWRKENVIGLIEDMKNKKQGEKIHLGIVILKKNKDRLEVIDGQQRLLTLSIFANNVLEWMNFCLLKNPLPTQNTTSDAQQYLLRAQEVMLGYKKEDFSDILENAVFSVVTLDENESADLAFSFFSHTNSAGMPLSDYDLLKTHHLRYLDKDECLAQKAVNDWNMLSATDRVQLVHNTLFRLRKWSAGESFPIYADDPRLRAVFKHFRIEIDPLEGCSSWPRPMQFNSILNGGEEFFSYISEYQRYYSEFQKQESIQALRESFAWHSYGTLLEGMLPLCFLFYCKFGDRYLPEAAYCIAYRISELRNSYSVMQKYLSIKPIFQECTIIINRATLEGEFFARLLDPRKNYEITNRGTRATYYWNALHTYMKEAEQKGLRLPKQFHRAGRFEKMLKKEEKKNEQ